MNAATEATAPGRRETARRPAYGLGAFSRRDRETCCDAPGCRATAQHTVVVLLQVELVMLAACPGHLAQMDQAIIDLEAQRGPRPAPRPSFARAIVRSEHLVGRLYRHTLSCGHKVKRYSTIEGTLRKHISPCRACEAEAGVTTLMMTVRRWTQDDLDTLRQMTEAGCGPAEIGRKLARSPEAIAIQQRRRLGDKATRCLAAPVHGRVGS
jgi:hypothetical protein